MSPDSTEMVVTAVTPESSRVVSLSLAAPDRRPLPRWEPGAHIDLVLGNGLTRQYSLCGDVDDRHHYRVAVLREPNSRGGSAYIHEKVQSGSIIRIRTPRNNFPLIDADYYQFVAGGIGITPLLPMIAAVERRRAPWRLLYGGKSVDSMAFLDEIGRHQGHITVCASNVSGRMDLEAALSSAKPGTAVYCCGPSGLVTAVKEGCERWATELDFRYELFQAPDDQAIHNEDDLPFEVECAASNVTLTVPPGTTILERVKEAGIDVLSDCEDGVCGSCDTPIISGEADHRDHVLDSAEQQANTCMMICVSRARGDKLVLDL
ncbi:PDR/VanB family oxidoreductase [Rhodococcus opacus]|uniref:Oxidoreductase n=1 Tax=Rhodococcus opacus TaxID=37919 RepID=A0A076F0B2_RHOOP|nr:PDR/VanB family oxidoreductase [Rhodococcus opacus]AII10867.1 hypothetical protein EP51_42710 [Rhodococcus opacus]